MNITNFYMVNKQIKELKHNEIDLITKLTYKIIELYNNGMSKDELIEKYPLYTNKYNLLFDSIITNKFNEKLFLESMEKCRNTYDPGAFFKLV